MPEIRAAVDGIYRIIDQVVLGSREEPPRREQPAPSSNRLMRTIEAEVIPRLLLIHGGSAAAPRPGSTILASEVELLVSRLLSKSEWYFENYLSELRARGIDDETILLDLLAPSARLLGVMWKNDLCDFTNVTIALNHLQRMVRVISSDIDTYQEPIPSGPTVMLAATPGEQHTFGLSIVGEFFRRAGWVVCDDMPESEHEIVSCTRQRWLSVVGFSLSGEVLLDRLASVIRSVRNSSRNREVGVIVGGSIFQEHPDWVAHVGADACALDGRQAVIQSLSLARLMAKKSHRPG